MDAALRLRPPRLEDEAPGRVAHEELDDYAFFLDYSIDEPWPAFVHRVDCQSRRIDVPPDRVPSAFLIAWVGDQIVGRTSIRFELNEHLAATGGHLGYAVLPAHRRRGYATEILRQSLVVARANGVDQVLLTTAVDNDASRLVIERCGGEYESTIPDPTGAADRHRYWIR